MNNQPLLSTKKLIFISSIAVLSIIVISILIKILTDNHHKVIINNISTCSPNITIAASDHLSSQFYSYITEQDNLNNVATNNTYHANFRESTCQTEEFKDDNGISYKTTVITDFTDRQYSYKITYYWTAKANTPKNIDLASLSVYCLSDQDSIYPDFNCAKLPNIQQEADPILSLLPYFGEHFSLRPSVSTTSTSGYGIIITYDPPESIYLSGRVAEFQQQTDATITDFLSAHHINIEDYSLVKKFAVVGVD